MMQIAVPLTDLLRTPQGPRDRQLLLGDRVEILGKDKVHYHVKDETGYKGYISRETVSDIIAPTHIVKARSSHAYVAPDFKSIDCRDLSFNAKITALSETDGFIETAVGFVPKQHLQTIHSSNGDLITAATLLLGTPYLWGGNSGSGIDCSGLVEAALRATRQPVIARDSGDQQSKLGSLLPPNSRYMRNDLLFWKGHVALVANETTIIHANAHHMVVAFEDIETAKTRIKQQGGGGVTAHKRV